MEAGAGEELEEVLEVRLRGEVPHDSNGDCGAVSVYVTLEERLGRRRLVDEVTGRPVRSLLRCADPPTALDISAFCAELDAR